MRSVSLVEKIELDFKGTVFQNAICLTDIDNDGLNELCVCNIDGELNVFKGIEDSKPCFVNSGIGSVVVLCGGCLMENENNVLCAIDTEGCIRIFDVPVPNHHLKQTFTENDAVSIDSMKFSQSKQLRLLHQGKLAPNSKVGFLQDIDEDGSLELIVGYTDRFVRIYKWRTEEASKAMLSNEKSDEQLSEQRKTTLSFSLSLNKDESLECSPKKNNENPYDGGSFVLYRQFSLLAQLGSIAICKTIEGLNQLIVSQPNGGYCILGVYGHENNQSEMEESLFNTGSPANQQIETYPTFYPINPRSSRSSSHTDTQVIGGIKRNNQQSGVLGLCTQDGHFMVLDNSMECNVNPVKNISEHRWFSMSKIDATNNGNDEIVLCSMNGMTYVIDKERDIVSFNFNENVAAFYAGHYGMNDNENSLSLCYVTMSGRIVIYYDFTITAMKVKCVHGALIAKLQEHEELKYILDKFRFPNGRVNHQKLQELVKNLWSEKTTDANETSDE